MSQKSPIPKIFDQYRYGELQRELHLLRQGGESIVFTNGCFDVLHRGHLELLNWAKRCGDVLVVAINSDESVRYLKGTERPVNNQEDRAFLLACIECVDYVTIFGEYTPAKIIAILEPDVLVKGGDYEDVTTIVGYDTVVGRGGKVLLAPFIDGYTSTNIIKESKLKKRKEHKNVSD